MKMLPEPVCWILFDARTGKPLSPLRAYRHLFRALQGAERETTRWRKVKARPVCLMDEPENPA